MQKQYLIRTLHIKQDYAAAQHRFRGNKVFEERGGGISVFCDNCARFFSNNICEHIDIYYYPTLKHPYLFWKIDVTEIRNFINFQLITSEGGIVGKNGDTDICHKDIVGIPKEKAEEFADKFCKPPNVFVCINGEEQEISQEQFVRLREWAKEKGLLV